MSNQNVDSCEKKVLMVIAPQAFRDEELLVPRQLFLDKGWHVDTASTFAGKASGMLGSDETVSLTLDQVQTQIQEQAISYDAVVVVGGMGSPEHLWNNTTLHQLAQTLYKENKVVSAICLSGAVLANAGVLQGKKATVWEMPESLACLESGGAVYTGEAVTQDGHLITANGPDAAKAFGEAIIQQVLASQAVTA
jgi:protease I